MHFVENFGGSRLWSVVVYGRSQKLTPPDPGKKPTEIVFSSSFLKMQIYVYHFLQLLE